jgi:hypothetical protein
MTTLPNIRLFAQSAIKAGLGVVLIGVLLTGVSILPVAAQSTHTPDGDATVSELAQMLTSTVDAQRIRALQRVTELAYHTPDVDLTSAVPALVDIYNNDPDKRYRLAAVSALHAIGDEQGMRQVRKRVLREPSLSVQYAAVGALLHHLGPYAFSGGDVPIARNIIARKEEAGRLSQTQQPAPVVADKN